MAEGFTFSPFADIHTHKVISCYAAVATLRTAIVPPPRIGADKKMVVIEPEEAGSSPVERKAEAKENRTAAAGPSAAEKDGDVVDNGDEEELFEDALNEEQLEQRVLSQANDAKIEGNKLFGSGKYVDALSRYDIALQTAPEGDISVELRSMCHANRAICFSKMGNYEDTIKECTKALQLNPSYIKALMRRGEAHEKLEHYEESIADMKKIIELDSSNVQAARTIQRLEPLAAEKREKMKEEMVGKLKEMGNSILGRFGMSVDNFKAVQDPNTGSYSISFQR